MTFAAAAAKSGDLLVAASFHNIWVVDFEYKSEPGDRPEPVCMVAKNISSSQEIRLWGAELTDRSSAPFNVGTEDLFVSFYAPAEIGCYLSLGWRLPENVLDLFAENRVATNGMKCRFGDGLLGALARRSLSHQGAVEKDAMRELILGRQKWTSQEQRKIINYCASDVAAVELLFKDMEDEIDWPRALLRGSYTKAVATMESCGIPIDQEAFTKLKRYWRYIRGHLIAEVDRKFGVYEGFSFRAMRFERYLEERGIAWPRLETGKLKLDKNTFREQARKWPEVEPLRQLRQSLSEMKLNGLQIGADGRNRTMLSPFGAVTGRNQPSNAKFIFGPSRWMRALIKPAEGRALAYIDWSSQEIAIAAALSGDELLMEAYRKGDPYLEFAKQAKLVPADATAQSHRITRDRCKEVVLGVNYGMGTATMAQRAGITERDGCR